MDLVPEDRKAIVFEKRSKQLQSKAGKFTVKTFATSIWEISLYKAWTEIVSSLISSMGTLRQALSKFAEASGAKEINLFEKNTFLLTCSYPQPGEGQSSSGEGNAEGDDGQRFEKISHIIKKFKLSCMSSKVKFRSMVISTKNFTAYLDEFTTATYIMIILGDKKVNLELLRLNVALARDEFEKIMNQ